MSFWSMTSRSARLRSAEVGLSSGVLGCSASCQSRSEYVIRSVFTPALTVATILSTTCCAEHVIDRKTTTSNPNNAFFILILKKSALSGNANFHDADERWPACHQTKLPNHVAESKTPAGSAENHNPPQALRRTEFAIGIPAPRYWSNARAGSLYLSLRLCRPAARESYLPCQPDRQHDETHYRHRKTVQPAQIS